jgi:hypothetical protein
MMLQIKTIMSVLKVITTSIAAHPIRLTVIISVLTFKSAVILYISTHTYLQNRILKILLSPIGANFELIPAHFENMGKFSCFFLQFFDESVSAKFQWNLS